MKCRYISIAETATELHREPFPPTEFLKILRCTGNLVSHTESALKEETRLNLRRTSWSGEKRKKELSEQKMGNLPEKKVQGSDHACTRAKLLRRCLTLCYPMGRSPPGSSVISKRGRNGEVRNWLPLEQQADSRIGCGHQLTDGFPRLRLRPLSLKYHLKSRGGPGSNKSPLSTF